MLNITINDFISLLQGVYARVKADNVATPQCFDVAQLWARIIGSPPFTGATADLIYNQPGDFYTQIPNMPDNYPQAGDLVVFNWPHVGLATGNNTDVNQFELLEQNDPDVSEIHIKIYPNYDGVIGWLRPKQLPASSSLPSNYTTIIQKSSQWDTTCNTLSLGDPNTTLYDSLSRVIAGYKSQQTASINKINDLQTQVNVSNTEISNKDQDISRINQQLLNSESLRNDLISSLKKANQNILDSSTAYEGHIKTLQDQITALSEQNNTLRKQLVQIQIGQQSILQSIWQKIISFFSTLSK